jgi:hypothetical protein
VFNTLDSDGNGQISLTEAGLDESGGCAGCFGSKGFFGLGELFLSGLSLMVLTALGKRRI